MAAAAPGPAVSGGWAAGRGGRGCGRGGGPRWASPPSGSAAASVALPPSAVAAAVTGEGAALR